MKNLIRVAILEARFMVRDKIALFFTFFFPFFLLFLFGSIWGKYPGYYGTLIPMLIVMAALTGGLFGVGISLTQYRETGVFRRLSLTPLSSRSYILGTLLCRITILMVETIVLLVIMGQVLKQGIAGSFFALLVFIVTGILAMLSLGALIATLAKNTDAAIAVGNIIFTPIMFLSGGFIPLTVLPPFMQKFAQVSPVYHFITPMQNIILKGHGLAQEWLSLVFLLVFFALCSLFSRRLFASN